DRIADELGGVAVASKKRISGRCHPGQIPDHPGAGKPGCPPNLTVPMTFRRCASTNGALRAHGRSAAKALFSMKRAAASRTGFTRAIFISLLGPDPTVRQSVSG